MEWNGMEWTLRSDGITDGLFGEEYYIAATFGEFVISR